MVSDIWCQTIQRAKEETHCRHMGYSFRLTARVLLYAQSHRQDCKYHGLCYISRGALAGTRNSSIGPPHEGLIQRPIAPFLAARQSCGSDRLTHGPSRTDTCQCVLCVCVCVIVIGHLIRTSAYSHLVNYS